jgi:hypothetical protein
MPSRSPAPNHTPAATAYPTLPRTIAAHRVAPTHRKDLPAAPSGTCPLPGSPPRCSLRQSIQPKSADQAIMIAPRVPAA